MMKTKKLYDIDSFQSEFSADVLECEKCENGYNIVLSATAFFPEGGGQAGDRGFIDGVSVLDTQINDDIIYHLCEEPIEVGKTVKAKLDFSRRFAFMQNHSGEHVISGIINRLYGFDNVGFHLGEDFATLDFNGLFTPEQLSTIEQKANQKVWDNLSIKAYYPKEEELRSLSYRSKKEIDGDIRIVEIEATDICACCAPHVKSTGQIGLIKFFGSEKMRGGTRIYMKCGAFALEDCRKKYNSVSAISNLLSSAADDIVSAVENLLSKNETLDAQISQLKQEIIDSKLKQITQDDNCVFLEGLEMKQIQETADSLHKTYGGTRAVFSKNGEAYTFAICGAEDEVKSVFERFKSEFSVRGGGRGTMVQGSVEALENDIKLFFKS